MELLGGALGLLLSMLLLILAIFWLVFPWMVYAKLNAMILSLKRLEDSHATSIHIFNKVARHLETIERQGSAPSSVLTSSEVTYSYSSDGHQYGPLTAADLRRMRKDGLITDDTPVVRSDQQEWKTFRDFLALNR